MRPVNASVAAKQARKMLLLVWSRGLLFTAIITSTLSTTVKGQVMLLMITVMRSLSFLWHRDIRCVAFCAGHICSVCKINSGEVGHVELKA